MTTHHKTLVRRWVDEVINQADPSAVTELATTSYAAAHHETNLRMQSAFPDAHMSIEDIIADDHKAVLCWYLHGTHSGNWRGIAPTQKPVEWTGITVYSMVDGKIDEEWTSWNRLDMVEQLVGLPDWYLK